MENTEERFGAKRDRTPEALNNISALRSLRALREISECIPICHALCDIDVMKPLVSIGLPSLNHRRFLEARMESILAQTLHDWELIVCDSYSNDGSWEYFQRYSSDARIKLHQVPREGPGAGFTECVKRAQGKYVYIATSDDTADPRLLEKMTVALEAQPDVDLAICRFDRIDLEGGVVKTPESDIQRLYGDQLKRAHRRDGKTEFLIGCCLGCDWETLTASFCRRQLFERTGGFPTDCGQFHDIEWRLRAVLETDLIYLPEPLATFRVYPGQPTSDLPEDWTRIQLRLAVRVIDQCREKIPGYWRQDPDWRDLLLRHFRHLYLSSYRLDRAFARKFPLRFFKGLMRAMKHEPRYALGRILRGLPWDDEYRIDDLAHFHALKQRWKISWPPVSL